MPWSPQATRDAYALTTHFDSYVACHSTTKIKHITLTTISQDNFPLKAFVISHTNDQSTDIPSHWTRVLQSHNLHVSFVCADYSHSMHMCAHPLILYFGPSDPMLTHDTTAHDYICSTCCGQTGQTGTVYHIHTLGEQQTDVPHTPSQNQHKHKYIHLWIREENKKEWCIKRKITLTKTRWRGMSSPPLPEGLSSEILEMLIRVNQVRPSTEGTVAVLEAASTPVPSYSESCSAARNSSFTSERKNRFQRRFSV